MAAAGIFMTPADLDQWKEDMRVIIREELSKLKVGAPEQVLSRKEAARFMGESVSTFNEKFKRGEYPTKLRHGNGRVKKYFKSELEAYLKRS